jgi:hypothetical protein
MEYQCGACLLVFDARTGTALDGIHRSPSHILMALNEIAMGIATARVARDLAWDRLRLLALRHRLHEFALRWLDRSQQGNRVVDADEMYQDVGGKASPISTPKTRRDGAPARSGATAPGPMTVRPSAVWPAAGAVRSD